MTEYRISKRVSEQFDAFMSGFNELIPQELINVFDERELELLIGGMSEIDVDDWQKHTDYRGYNPSDEVVEWFWKIVRTWPAERKSRLLQFSTGKFLLFAWGGPLHGCEVGCEVSSGPRSDERNADYDRYFSYPRERFQRPPRFRWSPSFHARTRRRCQPAAQVAHVFQQN